MVQWCLKLLSRRGRKICRDDFNDWKYFGVMKNSWTIITVTSEYFLGNSLCLEYFPTLDALRKMLGNFDKLLQISNMIMAWKRACRKTFVRRFKLHFRMHEYIAVVGFVQYETEVVTQQFMTSSFAVSRQCQKLFRVAMWNKSSSRFFLISFDFLFSKARQQHDFPSRLHRTLNINSENLRHKEWQRSFQWKFSSVCRAVSTVDSPVEIITAGLHAFLPAASIIDSLTFYGLFLPRRRRKFNSEASEISITFALPDHMPLNDDFGEHT